MKNNKSSKNSDLNNLEYIKSKILQYSTELKKIAIESVYLKLSNKNDSLEEKYKSIFQEFRNIKLGCFVSFYIDDNLRGCIGTIEPVFENVVLEVINNAISSAFKDPRFKPISLQELPYLKTKIDFIINIEKIDNLESLNPRKYGVIVKSLKNKEKRGVLLPDIQGVDTIEDQLKIVFNKAGLIYNKENLFKENEIYKFEVIRI